MAKDEKNTRVQDNVFIAVPMQAPNPFRLQHAERLSALAVTEHKQVGLFNAWHNRASLLASAAGPFDMTEVKAS